ncbi:MAG: hypothetical protein JW845_06760 [Dehalococcoidales bacterium]|nr:hypothetical protein [Dehalococcoidales bacterium]
MAEKPQEQKTRQEVREEKLRKKKAKIKQHGKGLAKTYRDAVEKRKG